MQGKKSYQDYQKLAIEDIKYISEFTVFSMPTYDIYTQSREAYELLAFDGVYPRRLIPQEIEQLGTLNCAMFDLIPLLEEAYTYRPKLIKHIRSFNENVTNMVQLYNMEK